MIIASLYCAVLLCLILSISDTVVLRWEKSYLMFLNLWADFLKVLFALITRKITQEGLIFIMSCNSHCIFKSLAGRHHPLIGPSTKPYLRNLIPSPQPSERLHWFQLRSAAPIKHSLSPTPVCISFDIFPSADSILFASSPGVWWQTVPGIAVLTDMRWTDYRKQNSCSNFLWNEFSTIYGEGQKWPVLDRTLLLGM